MVVILCTENITFYPNEYNQKEQKTSLPLPSKAESYYAGFKRTVATIYYLANLKHIPWLFIKVAVPG